MENGRNQRSLRMRTNPFSAEGHGKGHEPNIAGSTLLDTIH